MTDVSERLSEIRERVEAATEGPECSVQIESLEDGEGVKPVYNLYTHAEADQRYLLSLVDYFRQVLCLHRCNCDGTPALDPEKHAAFCKYVKVLDEISTALRDAAQEGAE